MQNLVTRFPVKGGILRRTVAEVHAVENVSFDIRPGERIPVDGTVTVQDGGGAITVDGTVTANAGTGPWPVTDNGGTLSVDDGAGSDGGAPAWGPSGVGAGGLPAASGAGTAVSRPVGR